MLIIVYTDYRSIVIDFHCTCPSDLELLQKPYPTLIITCGLRLSGDFCQFCIIYISKYPHTNVLHEHHSHFLYIHNCRSHPPRLPHLREFWRKVTLINVMPDLWNSVGTVKVDIFWFGYLKDSQHGNWRGDGTDRTVYLQVVKIDYLVSSWTSVTTINVQIDLFSIEDQH